MPDRIPGVLVVTGAYFPLISGGAVQTRALVRALGDRVKFRILTTMTDRSLPAHETIDGVPVYRVMVAPSRRLPISQILELTGQHARAAAGADVVHIQGVSKKNVVVTA